MLPVDTYNYTQPIEQQFPVGSLVGWTFGPDDAVYWRGLDATPGEAMLVLDADSEWRPPVPTGSCDHFPACKVLQSGRRRWVAAMYLRKL